MDNAADNANSTINAPADGNATMAAACHAPEVVAVANAIATEDVAVVAPADANAAKDGAV